MIILFGRNNESHDYYLRKLAKNSGGRAIFVEHPLKKLSGLKWLLYKLHNSEKINKIFPLPFRDLWAGVFFDGQIRKIVENDGGAILFFSGDHYALDKMHLFSYIRKKFKRAKSVYEFSDIVSLYERDYRGFSVERAREKFDILLTYNKVDVGKYGFLLTRPFLPDYDDVTEDVRIPYSDVFFIGRDKGRLKELLNIYKICTDVGLCCEFFIVGVDEERQITENGIHYNKMIDYIEVLKYVRKTGCLLNIVQEDSDGLTLRDYEAIGMGKYLITNRSIDEALKIHCSEGVIDIDNIKAYAERIKEKKGVDWIGGDAYNSKEWCDWIERICL